MPVWTWWSPPPSSPAEARWQRCTVHFYRNMFSGVPSKHVRAVAKNMLMAIHAIEDRQYAMEKGP
jgi:transposase-like protein